MKPSNVSIRMETNILSFHEIIIILKKEQIVRMSEIVRMLG